MVIIKNPIILDNLDRKYNFDMKNNIFKIIKNNTKFSP